MFSSPPTSNFFFCLFCLWGFKKSKTKSDLLKLQLIFVWCSRFEVGTCVLCVCVCAFHYMRAASFFKRFASKFSCRCFSRCESLNRIFDMSTSSLLWKSGGTPLSPRAQAFFFVSKNKTRVMFYFKKKTHTHTPEFIFFFLFLVHEKERERKGEYKKRSRICVFITSHTFTNIGHPREVEQSKAGGSSTEPKFWKTKHQRTLVLYFVFLKGRGKRLRRTWKKKTAEVVNKKWKIFFAAFLHETKKNWFYQFFLAQWIWHGERKKNGYKQSLKETGNIEFSILL